MEEKVYIVIESWDEGNNENVRAAFTNQKDAQEYADSQQGDWNYYAIDLDKKQPDNSMRIWSIEINTGYPNISHQHDVNWFKPKKNTFYMEQEGSQLWIVFFVEANRESKAFEQAREMYGVIMNNPDKYEGYDNVHRHSYLTGIGDLFDFETGNKLEEYIRDEQK